MFARLAEEAVDDPDFAEEENCPDVRNKNQPETETEKEEMMPVPQVKIGPDGNIILDEQRYKHFHYLNIFSVATLTLPY